MQYVLDSTFVIDYLRGFPEAVERFHRFFEDGDQPIVNDVVVCETAFGSRHHPDPALTAMLDPVEFVQPGPEQALLAGQWRAEARGIGRTLSLADALIAAAADSLGAIVLTRNLRDFALTPVRVETY